MALLWIDGFDSYRAGGPDHTSISPPPERDAAPIMRSSLYVAANDCGVTTDTRTGRGRALQMIAGSGGAEIYHGYFKKAFELQDEIVVGFAYKFTDTTLDEICRFQYDNLLGTVLNQCRIYVNGVGGITINIGGGRNAYSAPNTVFPDVWHYIEIKYRPRDDATGRCIVRVDGEVVVSLNGPSKIVVPNEARPNLVNVFWFGQHSGDYFAGLDVQMSVWIDDLYILNTQGEAFNDFLGDVVVHSVMPNEDAGPNQANQYGGGLAKFTSVDEIGPDEDLSYVYSNAIGVKEMYGVEDLPQNIIDVLAVSVHVRAKKDAAGLSTYKIGCKVDGIEEQSSLKTVTTQYVTRNFIMETKPGGGAWTKEDADNMQIGFELG